MFVGVGMGESVCIPVSLYVRIKSIMLYGCRDSHCLWTVMVSFNYYFIFIISHKHHPFLQCIFMYLKYHVSHISHLRLIYGKNIPGICSIILWI